MTLTHILKVFWARRWLVLTLMVLVAAIGIALTMLIPKQYTAEATMVVETRMDPVLGALAPGLASPGYMATQIEIIRSDRVASRVVQILGFERSAKAIEDWRKASAGQIPIDRYYAVTVQRGVTVEAVRGSNLIMVSFVARDPAFAQAAANAFVQAYLDVSVEMRVDPARQSAQFLDEQTKVLRGKLEEAQAKLSKFQQEKGIVVSDERMDQENMRYNALAAQLTAAQGEMVEASTRQRNSGSETSPDVLSSPTVQALKSQLATAQGKLTELSAVVGTNHPARIQAEAQIAELRQQLAAEIRRVSGGSSTVNRGSAEKVGELKALLDAQKAKLLAMRSDHDQIAVYLRDVDTAQKAYDAVSSRVGQFNLESQNNQASTRRLSEAVLPLEPSRPKVMTGVLGSIVAGLLIGLLAALGLEVLDKRVRSPEDLLVVAGVPVIGVLRPEHSRLPAFRRSVLSGPPLPSRPQLSGPGSRQ